MSATRSLVASLKRFVTPCAGAVQSQAIRVTAPAAMRLIPAMGGSKEHLSVEAMSLNRSDIVTVGQTRTSEVFLNASMGGAKEHFSVDTLGVTRGELNFGKRVVRVGL